MQLLFSLVVCGFVIWGIFHLDVIFGWLITPLLYLIFGLWDLIKLPFALIEKLFGSSSDEQTNTASSDTPDSTHDQYLLIKVNEHFKAKEYEHALEYAREAAALGNLSAMEFTATLCMLIAENETNIVHAEDLLDEGESWLHKYELAANHPAPNFANLLGGIEFTRGCLAERRGTYTWALIHYLKASKLDYPIAKPKMMITLSSHFDNLDSIEQAHKTAEKAKQIGVLDDDTFEALRGLLMFSLATKMENEGIV